jgi:hypothetical protein
LQIEDKRKKIVNKLIKNQFFIPELKTGFPFPLDKIVYRVFKQLLKSALHQILVWARHQKAADFFCGPRFF